GIEWIDLRLLRIRIGWATTETEDYTGIDDAVFDFIGHDRVQPQWRVAKRLLVGARETKQVSAEVIKRKISERHTAASFLQIEYLILQSEKLLVAPARVAIGLCAPVEQIVIAGRRKIDQRHACLDPILEAQVFVEVLGWP